MQDLQHCHWYLSEYSLPNTSYFSRVYQSHHKLYSTRLLRLPKSCLSFPTPPLLSSPLLASHFSLPIPFSYFLFSSSLFSLIFFIFFFYSCNLLFLTFLLGSLSCFLFLHKNNRNCPCVCLRSSPIYKNVLDKLLPVGEMPTFEVHPFVWRHCLQKLFMKMWVIPNKVKLSYIYHLIFANLSDVHQSFHWTLKCWKAEEIRGIAELSQAHWAGSAGAWLVMAMEPAFSFQKRRQVLTLCPCVTKLPFAEFLASSTIK